MALNSSGTLSIGGATVGQSINLELNRAATATSNLNETELRTLAGVASGQISVSNFYGKSTDITSQYALYMGSEWGGGATYIFNCNKYGYSTATSVATTAIPTSRGAPSKAAAGTTTLALMGGGVEGYCIATTTKFTFAGNSIANATNLAQAKAAHAAIGNNTYAVFGYGQTTNGISPVGKTTSIYTYSNNTCVAGTNLTGSPTWGGVGDSWTPGCNNGTYGYFFSSGTGANYLDRWNLTNNTKTSSYNYQDGYFAAATSTTTTAYLSQGGSHGSYVYSSNAYTMKSALPGNPQAHYGAGNGTIGCYASYTNIIKYTYSSDSSVTVNNNFGYTAQGGCAASNPPGSF